LLCIRELPELLASNFSFVTNHTDIGPTTRLVLGVATRFTFWQLKIKSVGLDKINQIALHYQKLHWT